MNKKRREEKRREEKSFYICHITYRVECPNLVYNTRQVFAFISQNGFIQTDDPITADYIIVAGCGATNSAEKLTLQKVWDISKVAKPDAVKIVYGCISTIAEEKLKKHRDLILIKHGEEQKFNEIFSAKIKIDDIISNISTEIQSITDFDDIAIIRGRPLSNKKKHQKELCTYLDRLNKTDKFTEAFKFCTSFNIYVDSCDDIFEIKIGQGCFGNCSYCAVKHAKGKLKSVPAEKILSQIKDGIKQGYKKFMFIADECSCWGKDINDNLCNLLDKIAEIGEKEKIPIKLIICYCHPDAIIEAYPKLLPHFLSGLIYATTLTFQTGSQKIMGLMNRRTDLEKLKFILKDMHEKKVPTYIFGQVIVGFPGETMADFYDTVEFFRDTYFDIVGAAPFSARPGTPAAKFKHQLSQAEILHRCHEMNLYANSFRSKRLLDRIALILDTIKK